MRPRARLALAALALLAVAGAVYVYGRSDRALSRYRAARVERGPIVATVSATGTLNAVVTVQVGSQVTGRIQEMLVDFNSTVKRGQLIARIDPESFEARVTQSKAQLSAARATVLNQTAVVERARADVATARATHAVGEAQLVNAEVAVADTRRQLERKNELLRKELIAQSEQDAAQAAHDSAKAQLSAARAQVAAYVEAIRAAEAQLRVAEAQREASIAQVGEREAALRQAEVDLANTRILAPVDGVVVSRNMDVGQTVVAALQSPTLFNIAQDLSQMQVHTSVDEADVGEVRVGQPVSFTVDAFRAETFTGNVMQIRKAAQVAQGVVTYTVVVSARNPTLTLLPGMTANVKIVVDRKESVLRVPNTALRFLPPEAEADERGPGGPAAQAAEEPGPGASSSVERLVDELDLGAAQRRQAAAILDRARRDRQGLPSDLPGAERQARARKIEESARAELVGILTPGQRARYAQLQPAPPDPGTAGRVWVLGADGRPRAVTVRVGATDGTFTELRGGAVAEGQRVLVGLTEPAATPAPRGRLRL